MPHDRYTGWFIQQGAIGKEFDGNTKKDKPFKFKVGEGKVIRGWEQGMLGLKKGGKRLLAVPASFGYGATGAGDRIPPNSTLLFEIALQKHKSKHAAAATPVAAPAAPAPAAAAAVAEAPRDRADSAAGEQSAGAGEAGGPKSRLLERMAKMGHSMLPGTEGGAGADEGQQQAAMGSPQQQQPQMQQQQPQMQQQQQPGFQQPGFQQQQPQQPQMQQPGFQQQQGFQQPGFQQQQPGGMGQQQPMSQQGSYGG